MTDTMITNFEITEPSLTSASPLRMDLVEGHKVSENLETPDKIQSAWSFAGLSCWRKDYKSQAVLDQQIWHLYKAGKHYLCSNGLSVLKIILSKVLCWKNIVMTIFLYHTWGTWFTWKNISCFPLLSVTAPGFVFGWVTQLLLTLEPL